MPGFSTISSAVVNKKSANCISTTGRNPVSAAPTPAPTNAFSEIGVSKTRSSPNCSFSPLVIRKIPPKLATSSPYRITLASRRISSSSASLIACAYVIVRIFPYLKLVPSDDSGVNVFERALWPWKRLLLHERDRAIDLRACVSVYFGPRRFDQHFLVEQLALVNRERIAAPMLLDFLARTIRIRIADPMSPQPISLRFDQRRPMPRARVLDRFGDRVEDLLDVVAVDRLAGDSITVAPIRDIFDGGGSLGRHRYRPAVVLAQKNDRQFSHRAEVQALVKCPAVGGSVAEKTQDHLVLVLHFDRQSSSRRNREASAERAAFAEHSELRIHH